MKRPETHVPTDDNLFQTAAIRNGRKAVRFIKNIIDPNGPPVPIYPDGTFPVNPRPMIPGATPQPPITGTPAGSFCPVDGHHTPISEKELARLTRAPSLKIHRQRQAALAAYYASLAPDNGTPPDRAPWRAEPTRTELDELRRRYPNHYKTALPAAPAVPAVSTLAAPPPSPKPAPVVRTAQRPKPTPPASSPTLF
jgi:hypothetical protein